MSLPSPHSKVTKAAAHPLKVYLDSSDYSTLSHPRAPAKTLAVRDWLVELASRPDVEFVYSGAHISEMSPLGADYAASAEARTRLMVSLCGRSTLVSPDRLLLAEFDRLNRLEVADISAIDQNGTWFPNIGEILTPSQQLDTLKAQLREVASEMGLNRSQRRLLAKKTFKAGKLRPEAVKVAGDGIDLEEILERYPMRRDAAEVLKQYVLGRVTAEAADQAFLESLRDPTWMMRWFQEHHERLSPIGEWLRGPAGKMADQMVEIASRLTSALRAEVSTGTAAMSSMLSAEGWKSAQDQFVAGTIVSIARKMNVDLQCGDASIADQFSPGTSMCLRVTHSSLRNSIGENAREPERSDFVDAVHSMYAPYVNLFRADRYMAPIIAKHAEKYGTEVVSRIEELPDRIVAWLGK